MRAVIATTSFTGFSVMLATRGAFAGALGCWVAVVASAWLWWTELGPMAIVFPDAIRVRGFGRWRTIPRASIDRALAAVVGEWPSRTPTVLLRQVGGGDIDLVVCRSWSSVGKASIEYGPVVRQLNSWIRGESLASSA